MITEVPIKYWDVEDNTNQQYWISEAMKAAVGQFFYNHIRGTNIAMPSLQIFVKYDQGVVVCMPGED